MSENLLHSKNVAFSEKSDQLATLLKLNGDNDYVS